ncbi:hypothetical protein HanIR_Chr11g0529921 [Helianthus annuus]|nr:hypothetical protein HanIR_Chr11g0529921 [Helianthus annuus]
MSSPELPPHERVIQPLLYPYDGLLFGLLLVACLGGSSQADIEGPPGSVQITTLSSISDNTSSST